MPTATTAGLLSLNNLGALTTTFTAPSSCATDGGRFRSGLANPGFQSMLLYPVDNCKSRGEFNKECIPHGDEASKIRESLSSWEPITLLDYYSPGLHCPHAWTTVGVYSPGDHSNSSALGIFSPTAFINGEPGESTSFPYGDFVANMFTSALAPAETAVVCCPSGFKVDPYAGCYSNFPVTSLAGKSRCIRHVTSGGLLERESYTYTYEFWGKSTTITPLSFVFPTNTKDYSTETVTLDRSGVPTETDGIFGPRPGDNDDDMVGVVNRAPIFLVQGSGGTEGPSDGKGGEDKDGDKEDGKKDDDPNAAGRLSPATSWGPIAGVLAAWGLSVAAGFGLLVVW